MIERWRPIPESESYAISDHGRVKFTKTNRIKAISLNQQGIPNVNLYYDGVQHRRSVALLVAEAFLKKHSNPRFNTPVNLDGNRKNNHYSNLVWRPRWFAIKYHAQFHNGKRGYNVPVREIRSGEVFPTSWDAAMRYGLIDRDIMVATMNRTTVFPDGYMFEVVDDF